jgi:cysteine-S-conjugate beta-lyase
MAYNFDLELDRRATESAKWGVYDDDVLPMWVADMDFVSPEPVLTALQNRVSHGIFGYPMEVPALKEVIVDRMAELYAWQIMPEDVMFLPGVVVAVNLTLHALSQPGDGALIQTPVYPPFFGAPLNAKMKLQEMELTLGESGGYEIDFQAFEESITGDTRVFILCNPHNPIGRVFRRDELEKMAEICLRHDVVICSDEIHCDLLFKGVRHIPTASLNPEVGQNTVTLMAPSKTYNIAGLKCSVAIVQNAELREKLNTARQGLVGSVNLLGLTAALAAYKDGQEWLGEVLEYMEGNRDFLFDYVSKEMPGIRMEKPEGTYLAWLDCRESVIEGSPYQFFLEKARVGLNDGVSFGKGGEGFVRLNFGCPRKTLEKGLMRMRNALINQEA